jgi:hypothetical protein
MNPARDLRHVELNSRCALPGLFEGEDGNNPYTILQPPGKVVILYDYNHTSRVVDLSRKEHLGKNIRLFMGDSIGHWEGNMLIIDTANFNGRVAYSREIPYLSEDLHTVERFTIVDENTIDYESHHRRSETIHGTVESRWIFLESCEGRRIARVRMRRRQPNAAKHFWDSTNAIRAKEVCDEYEALAWSRHCFDFASGGAALACASCICRGIRCRQAH